MIQLVELSDYLCQDTLYFVKIVDTNHSIISEEGLIENVAFIELYQNPIEGYPYQIDQFSYAIIKGAEGYGVARALPNKSLTRLEWVMYMFPVVEKTKKKTYALTYNQAKLLIKIMIEETKIGIEHHIPKVKGAKRKDLVREKTGIETELSLDYAERTQDCILTKITKEIKRIIRKGLVDQQKKEKTPKEEYNIVKVKSLFPETEEINEEKVKDQIVVKNIYELKDQSLNTENIQITGYIIHKQSVKEYTRTNGKKIYRQQMILMDETGKIRVVVWSYQKNAALFQKIEAITKDLVEIRDGIIVLNTRQGRKTLELYLLNKHSIIDLMKLN
ncbi:MAG: hypothetical protein ACXAC7_19895 [Candidatus Hodarchaeales archaeon]|jgi:hypothetical protein